MNWNIFKRLRALEATNLMHALTISSLLTRVEALESRAMPAAVIVKVAADKLLKLQAYRRAYYQKRKAAVKEAK